MQAVAINICTSEEYSPNIFSVNGPPGTGKTTLLKEIIADTVVKKSKIIFDLKSEVLEAIKTNTSESYYRNYYKVPEELKKLGIIVASNNNAAVENISKDLPNAKDVIKKNTLTGLFDVENNKDIYFTLDSDEIFKAEKESSKKEIKTSKTWGLISAPF